VSTLYIEAGQSDGFREPGFSKEHRLEPQITIGLLTGQDRFPLMVSAFEGNRAETKTMLPVIEKLMAAHHLPDVTVVADAGMIYCQYRADRARRALRGIDEQIARPRRRSPGWPR
jgi:transposase